MTSEGRAGEVAPAADLVQGQGEALAALAEALAALDRFVAGYAFVNSSQEMMVRGMVGALRGMRPSAPQSSLPG